ncbi:MAG: hypothetical protein DI566_02250 [Microbacterium sp.]|nr:MAG: hypothetical protein DI566_02250 [Microbacterium sp.]
MPLPRRRRASVLSAIALAAAAFALAGCVGSPGADADPTSAVPSDTEPSTQTVAEACEVVRTSVEDAADQLGSLDTSDPQAAFAALSAVGAKVQDAAAAVDNAEVSALLPGLQAGFTGAADALQGLAAGDLSKLPALQQAASDIQSSLAEFAELCPAE